MKLVGFLLLFQILLSTTTARVVRMRKPITNFPTPTELPPHLLNPITWENFDTNSTKNQLFHTSKMSVSKAHETTFFRVETKREKEWEDFRAKFLPFFLEMRKKYGTHPNRQTEFVAKQGGGGRVDFLRSYEPKPSVLDNKEIFREYYTMLVDKMSQVFANFLGDEVEAVDLKIIPVDSFCIWREKGGHHYYHTHFVGVAVNWVAVWYLALPEDKDHKNRLWATDYVLEQEAAILAEEGDLLLHPAWVNHGTEEIRWDGVRSVFATNVQVVFKKKENLNANLVKKSYNVPLKAQKISPYPLYFFQYYAPPGDLLQNYEQTLEEQGRGRRRRRNRNKDQFMRTLDEDVLEWVKTTTALGIAEINIQKNREREKVSKHFSYAFGECHYQTDKNVIKRQLGRAVSEQRFYSGVALSRKPEPSGEHYNNVNKTKDNTFTPYALFYFDKNCQAGDISLTITSKKFEFLNVREMFDPTLNVNFDSIVNSILGPTDVVVKGGESFLVSSPILQRIDLNVSGSGSCKVLLFHLNHFPIGEEYCHLL